MNSHNPLRQLVSEGQAHRAGGRFSQALECFQKASVLAPQNTAIVIAIAKLQRKMGETQRACELFEQAISMSPESAPAWNGLGATCVDSKDFLRAEHCFRAALRFAPGLKVAENNLAGCLRVIAGQMHTAAGHADWGVHERYAKQILTAHRARRKAGLSGLIRPFSVLGFQLTPLEQRDAAESLAGEYLREKGLGVPPRPALATDISQRRIRIGYLSFDFRNNALAHLTHRLFGQHDRNKFEVFAYSFGPDDGSEYRHVMQRDAEHFIDIADEKPAASARRMRADGIDILVDLMGFAGNHRAEICARRPAPIQVFWLGYCCTTGAPWIDYFIGDKLVSPPKDDDHFSEQVLRMPDCYQMYCGEEYQSIPANRMQQGLPENAMVYCCFNLTDKIDPPIFSRWMNILKKVPDSVLWMMEPRGDAQQRLQQWAATHGIDPQRLIFAEMKPKREHLARVALADLFLDTTLFGAHTTASDALWAGVPVLTCPGELFAQRVAASVCSAAGLPDLIVNTMHQYETEAVRLGLDRKALDRVKRKLKAARETAALFQEQQFTRNLENIYAGLCRQQPG